MASEDRIALFDMDGTIADYSSKLREDLMKISSKQDYPLIDGDLHSDTLPDWFWQRMNMIRKQHGWWESLEPIESGQGIMALCRQIGFRNIVLTKGPNNSSNAWSEKFNWCRRNVSVVDPDYSLTVTGDKSLHYGRVLVDDFPGYMIPWLENRPRALGLMPITPGNKDFSHPRVLKYDPSNWRTPELVDRLKEAYSRPSG